MKLTRKKTWLLGAALMLSIGVLAGCGSSSTTAEQGKKVYKVGIVQQIEHKALDETNKGFLAGLASKGYKEGENLKVDQQNAQGDQANLSTIAHRFIAEKDDLVGAIATNAAQTMANATKNIPIVGMAITDYEAAKLAASNEHPGGNVTGVSDKTPAEKPVELIKKILPQAKTVGVIYTSSEVNSEVQVKAFKAAAQRQGLTVKEASISNVNDIRQAVENLINQDVKAIYVPTDNILASAYPNLIQVATRAKIPVFPSESSAIEAGGLAMYSISYYDLGFQAGQMAADILSGKAKPADMAIQTAKRFRLFINEKEAKELGITIPADLLAEAKKADAK